MTSEAKYEFSAAENEKFSKLARRTKIWGWVAIISGAFCVLGLLLAAFAGPSEYRVAMVAGTLGGAFNIFIGYRYVQAAGALANVAGTEGDDVSHLLSGISSLSGAFSFEAAVGVVGAVAGFVLVFGGFISA